MAQEGMREKEKPSVHGHAINKISSPDQLTDYLRVTNPGIWIFLASVLLLLAGVFAWFTIGTLETVIPVKVRVESQQALVIPEESGTLEEGMTLRVSSEEWIIGSLGTDEYGRTFGLAEAALPDGVYSGTVVTERTHPIRFLLESR